MELNQPPRAYQLLPFAPEPEEALRQRFNAALCQIPSPPTRKHVFDFESKVRMIASMESDPELGMFIHLSFGLAPKCALVGSDIELQRLAYVYAATFVGFREPLDSLQTEKAFHLFYTP